MLERIKTMLDIKDALQDNVLNIIIENVTSHLVGKLKRLNDTIVDIPVELNYVIEEIAIRRYNRIGTEGMKSESVEGHRVDFYSLSDDFKPYDDIINGYEPPKQSKRGKVMFL